MIERYSYPQMRAIWEQENRYRKWLEVELLVAEGWAEIGRIPKEAAAKLRENGNKLLAKGFDFGEIVQRTLDMIQAIVTSQSLIATSLGDLVKEIGKMGDGDG